MMLRGLFLQALQTVSPCASAEVVFLLQHLNAIQYGNKTSNKS